MAYRLTGTDPFLRAAIGTFNGYGMRDQPLSGAMLLKRRAASAWHGIWTVDQGSTTPYTYPMEFNPTNQLAADMTTGGPFSSTATFNDTTNWMIVGFTTSGAAAGWNWRFKIGAGAWTTEADTATVVPAASAGSGYRHLIGNEPGLGDDTDSDIVCIGAIKSNLAQATFESLDMLSFATWQTVFTGAGAWLLGMEAIGTLTDRTGNGGDELARSAGITLVSDPSGWSWGGSPPLLLSAPQPPLIYLRRNT